MRAIWDLISHHSIKHTFVTVFLITTTSLCFCLNICLNKHYFYPLQMWATKSSLKKDLYLLKMPFHVEYKNFLSEFSSNKNCWKTPVTQKATCNEIITDGHNDVFIPWWKLKRWVITKLKSLQHFVQDRVEQRLNIRYTLCLKGSRKSDFMT